MISELIIKKIEIAFKKKQNFKVILMLPLLPGFEGHIADEGSSVMRVQLHL